MCYKGGNGLNEVFVPVFITEMAILIVFEISKAYRKRHKALALKAGRAGKRAEMCEEETTEAENDISSLSSSFLFISGMRFAISGVLPNPEGEEVPEVIHSNEEVLTLCGVGLVCALVAVALVALETRHHESKGNEETGPSQFVRWLEILMNASAMSFAWSFLWATSYVFSHYQIFHYPSMIGRVMLALVLSGFVCIWVFCLDTINDTLLATEIDAKAALQAIQTVINALAILVGFSWEHCFDGGVTAVAVGSGFPTIISKSVLALLVLIVIVPAWKNHILTTSMRMQDLKKERETKKDLRKGGHLPLVSVATPRESDASSFTARGS